ncbi:tRNA (adenine(22)-N(1))-methyltransferase [Alkalicoccus chagannorensis]|uniref:tRNA (adenine(22)-N(1))-methyltransferase n=1 Tax=Alkalicoccus chagannorensis TaxID=427072 RepID=UPI0003FFF329|nr:tRNA (adenine(22)-N(1))-methyltransferase TrmK [Alkalicoccus chagannorensis]
MNGKRLSKRLEVTASFVLKEGTVADIGSDHAYLPIHLTAHDLCEYAIAGELNEGPLQSAIEKIYANELEDRVEARLGNGLEVLEGRRADTVVIAGMGGPLIASILSEGKQYLGGVKRLVLQPNVAADQVRRWLDGHGWILFDEEILEEDGHIYEVLAAEPEGTSPYTEAKKEQQLWLGPYLMERKPASFRMKWRMEYDQLKRIRAQLQLASQQLAQERAAELEKKMSWIEEVLT